MKRLLIALSAAVIAAGLGACATDQGPAPNPTVVTKVVHEPVPVPCDPKLSPEPNYPDTDQALSGVKDVFEGAKLLKAGRKLRVAREVELKAALHGCGWKQ